MKPQTELIKASDWQTLARSTSGPPSPKLAMRALDRFDQLWGATDLSRRFRSELHQRGISLFDRHLTNHITCSAIVVDPATLKLLLMFHPYYHIWLQLGGHADDHEFNPVSISLREAAEESGINGLKILDWPVRIDPHPAYACKSSPPDSSNYHYDICYLVAAPHATFIQSNESLDMNWFSLHELQLLVDKQQAQHRALEMAQNALRLFDSVPPPASA